MALLPGTTERMEPLVTKRKKKKDEKDESKAISSGKTMSKAAKIRAVARGDAAVLNKTPLEEQQVICRLFACV